MYALTISDDGPWSLGVLIGGPIFGLILLGLIAAGIFLIAISRNSHYGDEGWIGGGILALAVVIAATLASPIGYYPFDAEYHQWRDVSGTVEKIDKRLIGSGDKMEDKFVVRFEGSEQQFGCDDTRCAQVEKGDALALSCKRAWQYTGTDGYDCRFVSTAVAR